MNKVIPLEGPGGSAECYRMQGRLGRMQPLPSGQIVTFVVKSTDEIGQRLFDALGAQPEIGKLPEVPKP